MSEHAKAEVLERFLLGQLTPEEARRVLAHLVGCSQCRTEAGSLGAFLRDFEQIELEAREAGSDLTPEEAAVSAESLTIYDEAIERALSAVRLHGGKARERKVKAERVLKLLLRKGLGALNARIHGWYPIYEALLTRAQALRHESPQKMVDHTFWALWVSGYLGHEGFTREQVADLRTRAHAEHGNALRVAERFLEAEREFENAAAWQRVGTGDPLIALRLADLWASLLGTRHRYNEALAVLRQVHSLSVRLGDRHREGRALLSKALYTGYMGKPLEAIGLIDEGLRKVDFHREPDLKASSLRNRLLFMVDGGLFQEALELMERDRGQFLGDGGRLDQAKLVWIEGRLHGALGRLDRAEETLRDVIAVFQGERIQAHAAMASLDLAVILMHRNATDEACRLADDAFAVFRSLKLNDAQAEALIVLREALEQRIVTAGFLKSLVEFLRRAEHDPYARYEPRFH